MQTPRFIAMCALAALSAAAASAEEYPTPPAPGAPREVKLATPREMRLPNGLRVIVAERHTLPLATATLLVRAGSEFDPPDRSGLASTTAALLTKGTRTRTAPEIAQTAEALGGSLDTDAAWHASSVSMTVTTPKLDAALALMADVVTAPTFAPDELERLRKQALDALRVEYTQPGALARAAATRAAFGTGAYGHPVSGTPSSIARVRRDDVVRLHRAVYRPDNAVLVIAGDITPDAAAALARTHFGAWTAPKTPLPKSPKALGAPLAAPIVAVDLPRAGQAGVVVAMPTIARDAPDYYAGQVANTLLGGGYSSRLNQEIRIKRGLSYGAGSALDARRVGGQMTLSAQTKNASAVEVVTLMREAMATIASSTPPADELAARKATLIGGVSRSVETTAGLARRVATLAIDDVPLDEIGKTIDKLQAITPDQVQAFARTHWTASVARVAVAGDVKTFGAALKAAEPRTRVVPITRLDIDRADLEAPKAATP